ncbi:MAG: hypothetical protein E5X12_01190, partial [Mesorhizobium sp.]
MVKLCRRQYAEAADNEGILVDPQLRSSFLFRRELHSGTGEWHGPHIDLGRSPVVLSDKFRGIGRMHDHARGVFHGFLAARIFQNRIDIRSQVFPNSEISVGAE